MRGLYSLYLLITTPPPNMRWFVLPAAVLIGGYLALRPFNPWLSEVGLPAFVLAVVLMHAVLIARAVPFVKPTEGVSDTHIRVALLVHLGVIGAMLLSADPLFCQRVWTAAICLRIAMLTAGLTLDRSILDDMPWVGRGLTEGRGNAARWAVVGAVMLIFVNEASILYGTLDQWILLRAIAQPVVYALVYWTILATHPYEDGPGA